MKFYMHARFLTRLGTLYARPEAKAIELAKRTAKERKARGFEVPVLCTDPGMMA